MNNTITNIIAKTNPTLIVKQENMIKGMYGKRQIIINYNNSQDLFDVWAFTLRGVNFSKEEKINGVFIENLQTTIEGLI
jgi:hypothetical protein